MAKTIREMALSYGREHQGTVDIEVFEVGANAVLSEIEKAMYLGEPPYLISVEQAYYRIKKTIEQLKGE